MSTIRIEHYDDVVRLRLRSAGGAAVGLDVSAYVYRGVLIDTGFPRAAELVTRAVDDFPVRAVAVTHWHEDHAGNVAALAARGLPIQMRPETARILRAPPRLRLYRRVVWGSPHPLASSVDASIDPLVTIHAPGHSADHQIVWDAGTRTLFSGDLWLGVRARTMHLAEEPLTLSRSLREAAALGPSRMFDAHRGPVADPVAALTAKADWLDRTIAAIVARIEDGWTDAAIRRDTLGPEDPAAYLSGGEYSRLNFVRAVRRARTADRGSDQPAAPW